MKIALRAYPVVALLVLSMLVVAPERAAATDIPPGHITTDTVWDVSGSPYNLLGTVIVDPGVSLTIGPGVQVVASAPNMTLFIEGWLNVTGTLSGPVVFAGASPWTGMVINTTSPSVDLRNMSMRDARRGLNASDALLKISHVDISGCAPCISIYNTTLIGDNLTIASDGDAVMADLSLVSFRDSVVRAGRGADSTPLADADDGGTALTLTRSGGSPYANGTTRLINVSAFGGDGGNTTQASRRAGSGGAPLVVSGGSDIHVESSYLAGGRGGTSSLQGGDAGGGGAGLVLQGTSYFWVRSDVRGGDGGVSLVSNSSAGDGGHGILVTGPTASTFLTFTGSKVYGGAGGDSNATLLTAGRGGDGVHFDAMTTMEFELFSMEIYGGKGGTSLSSGSTPGDGGDGVYADRVYRFFAYGNVIQAGDGGDVGYLSRARGGTGGTGVNIIYAQNMYSELGIFRGGDGGDDRSSWGRGGGVGGPGVVVWNGTVKIEVGEADSFGGNGGDVYANASAPAGDGAGYATMLMGGDGLILEYSSNNAGHGGVNRAGGPNGRAGNVTYIGVRPKKVILNGFYGVQGESDHCLRIYNASARLAGNIAGSCRVGLLAESPAGGISPDFESSYDTFWKNDVAIMLKGGASPTVVEAVIKENTLEGVRFLEGSGGTWSNIYMEGTPTAIHADDGSSPFIRDSKIGSLMLDILASNSSTVTLLNTTFNGSKVMVNDPASSVVVQNYLDIAVVDRRWNPVPRPEVRIRDNSNLVYFKNLKKDGTDTGIVLTDRVIRGPGPTENVTSASVLYRNWTFTAYPGPMSNINMSTSHQEWFRGSGATPPRVNATSPGKDQTNVSAGSKIRVEFTVPMNRSSVESAVSISGNLTPTGFTWSNGDRVVTFDCSPWLLPRQTYTITLNASRAKDDIDMYLDGNRDGLSSGSPLDDYQWTFHTGYLPNLTVLGNDTAPVEVGQGADLIPMLVIDLIADLSPLKVVSLRVDRTGVSMDTDVESVSIWRDMNSNARWDLGDSPLGFTGFTGSSAEFDLGGLRVDPGRVEHLFVVVNVSTTALIGDTVGVRISSQQSIRLMGADLKMPVRPIASSNASIGGDIVPPGISAVYPGGGNVPVNASITAVFDEPMNWTSVRGSLITVPYIPLSFNVSGNTAIFTPIQPLQYARSYTVTFRASTAKDRAGNLLDGNGNGISQGSPEDDYTWTFRTVPRPVGNLSGVVVDDVGDPVAYANISVSMLAGTSDISGRFDLQGIPVGLHTVTFEAQGYLRLDVPDVEIVTGTTTWLNVSMEMLAGTVMGWVRDDAGSPLANVEVSLQGLDGAVTFSDETGLYRLLRVPAGNRTLTAAREGHVTVSIEVRVTHGATTYTNITMHAAEAPSPPMVSPLVYAGGALAVLVILGVSFLLLSLKKRRAPHVKKRRSGAPDEEMTEGEREADGPQGPERETEEKGSGSGT